MTGGNERVTGPFAVVKNSEERERERTTERETERERITGCVAVANCHELRIESRLIAEREAVTSLS